MAWFKNVFEVIGASFMLADALYCPEGKLLQTQRLRN